MGRANITAVILVLLAMPIAAMAQPGGKVYRIGLLSASSQAPGIQPFREGLRSLGYLNTPGTWRRAGRELDSATRPSITSRRAILIGAASVVVARPAGGQQHVYRMGLLGGASAAANGPYQAALLTRLEALGYRVGHNLKVDRLIE